MMGYDPSGVWGWGIGMMLLMPLFWVLVVGATVWLVVRLSRADGAGRPSAGSPALRILEERLARGEIDPEEFRARRAVIVEGR